MSKTVAKPLASTPTAVAAFPSPKDVAAWEALSPAEKFAIVEADEEAGFRSGVAPKETAAEHVARVLRK